MSLMVRIFKSREYSGRWKVEGSAGRTINDPQDPEKWIRSEIEARALGTMRHPSGRCLDGYLISDNNHTASVFLHQTEEGERIPDGSIKYTRKVEIRSIKESIMGSEIASLLHQEGYTEQV